MSFFGSGRFRIPEDSMRSSDSSLLQNPWMKPQIPSMYLTQSFRPSTVKEGAHTLLKSFGADIMSEADSDAATIERYVEQLVTGELSWPPEFTGTVSDFVTFL
jgi:hypothetical protein